MGYSSRLHYIFSLHFFPSLPLFLLGGWKVREEAKEAEKSWGTWIGSIPTGLHMVMLLTLPCALKSLAITSKCRF